MMSRNGLHGIRVHATNRRQAFSLTELIVAIGLLALMMSLAGRVFTLSIQSTNQANALIKVSQSLRLLEETLRADLCNVDPDRSMMVIVANPINAYWTPEGKDLDDNDNPFDGYPHDPDPNRDDVLRTMDPGPGSPLRSPRADVLMFFTARDATSIVCPVVTSTLTQVVYGHAELGELGTDGRWAMKPKSLDWIFPETPDEIFKHPASTWHLARRGVLIVDAAENDVLGQCAMSGGNLPDTPDSLDLAEGLRDIIAQCDGSGIGTTACPDGELFYEQHVVVGAPWTNTDLPNWFARSRLDLTPPASQVRRLGHFFLPNCASFKVEWAFVHPVLKEIGVNEVVWVDPADVKGSLRDQLTRLSAIHATGRGSDIEFVRDGLRDVRVDGERRFDIDADGPAYNVHEFYARDPSGGSGPDPYFPMAVRITVDVYDESGRLSRPLRHVMVLPVGGDS